jgi:hypothetical protein
MAILLRQTGAVQVFELAANLGMERGENKDFVRVDIHSEVLSRRRWCRAPQSGLERPVQSLHGEVDEIDLAEEPAG